MSAPLLPSICSFQGAREGTHLRIPHSDCLSNQVLLLFGEAPTLQDTAFLGRTLGTPSDSPVQRAGTCGN